MMGESIIKLNNDETEAEAVAVTLIDTIELLIDNKKYTALREILTIHNEADIAVLFAELPESELPVLFRLLPKDLAADVFVHMDSDLQELLIKGFSDSELKAVLDEIYIDDAADLVEEMPANVVKRILANTDPNKRNVINEILKYPEDSAGSLMTTEYISLRPKMTVSEAIKRIRRTMSGKETIYTCYVTDDNRNLLGYISVKTLLLAKPDDVIRDIMEDAVICVGTNDDKEEVARKMSHYDFISMPVVDAENRLVGIVTFDDAIDVIQEETTEDIAMMAAIAPSEDSYFKTSDFRHAKSRVFWLLVLMLSAALTGAIITGYEESFSAMPILVSFIPMLMGTGGNCGSQSSTLVIRGMAVDEIKSSDFFKVLWLEFRVSLLLSVALAIVNGLRVLIQYRDAMLAIIISLSIIGTIIMSELIGAMLPMLAKKIKLDPAVMASPLITTIVDAGSILIYFNIACRFIEGI